MQSHHLFFSIYTCSMFHANKAIVQNIFGQPLIVVFLITTLVTSLRPTSCHRILNSGSWSQESLADFCCICLFALYTIPLTNIAPENGWLEDYFLFGKAYFQVRTVSFREGKSFQGQVEISNPGGFFHRPFCFSHGWWRKESHFRFSDVRWFNQMLFAYR